MRGRIVCGFSGQDALDENILDDILNTSQAYRPPRPVMRRDLLCYV
jgi:hypothetical protein